jgi:hypothetical protein
MTEMRGVSDSLGSSDMLRPPSGYERHFLGRFGEAVIAFLGRGESVGRVGDADVFIVVDSIELGDSPLAEEIGIGFHLSIAPSPPNHLPHWGGLAPGRHVEQALIPGRAAIEGEDHYTFAFTSAIPFDENVDGLLELLKGEAGMTPGGRRAVPTGVVGRSPSILTPGAEGVGLGALGPKDQPSPQDAR